MRSSNYVLGGCAISGFSPEANAKQLALDSWIVARPSSSEKFTFTVFSSRTMTAGTDRATKAASERVYVASELLGASSRPRASDCACTASRDNRSHAMQQAVR
jgi:hypothetical protein